MEGEGTKGIARMGRWVLVGGGGVGGGREMGGEGEGGWAKTVEVGAEREAVFWGWGARTEK